jgi:hypothetical protein
MDPAVQTDFVSFGDHATLFLDVKSCDNCRHEEGRRHGVAPEHLKYSGHGGPAAIVPPRQTADRLTSVPQLAAFVVRIKGEGNRATRAAFPRTWAQLAAGANSVDDPTPMVL